MQLHALFSLLVRMPVLSWLRRTGLLIGLFALSTNVVFAVGLGELTLHSSLGQRLDAEIQIVAANEDELKTLDAYLAASEVFEQMGIAQVPTHKDMQFSVEPDSPNGPVIKISSDNSVREPFVNFVIELSWAGGTYLREYTFLLDPVVTHRSKPKPSENEDIVVVANDAEEPVIASAQTDAQNTDLVNQVQSEANDSAAASEEYILIVNRGDSLLDIARAIKTADLSVEQVALAIYQRNPDAFYGSINNLNAGAELVIPNAQSMASRSERAAQLAMSSEMRKRAQSKPNKQASKDTRTTVAAVIPSIDESVNPTASQSAENEIALAQVVNTVNSPAVPVNNQTDSISALHSLIQDLRAAMQSLSSELNVRNDQLDDISDRVNQLQEQQSRSNIVADDAQTELVTPIPAVQVISEDKPSDNVPSDNSVSDEVTSMAVPDTQQPEPSTSTKDIGPLSMLEQDQPTVTANTDNRDATPNVPTVNTSVNTGTTEKPKTLTRIGSSSQTDQLARWLRNLGFVLLAATLSFIAIKRLWLESPYSNAANDMVELRRQGNGLNETSDITGNNTSENTGALSAIEFFKQQLPSDQRQELILKNKLKEDDSRQDLRLDLLRLYHSRGATERFAQTAREMYQMTSGKNTEWHTVIKLGLTLDPQMRFYSEAEDHGFTLSDEFAITGKKISSVSGGQSGQSVETDDDDSFEEDSPTDQSFAFDGADHQETTDDRSYENSTDDKASQPDNSGDRYDIDINFDEQTNAVNDDVSEKTFLDSAELDNAFSQPTRERFSDDDFDEHAKALNNTDDTLNSTFDQIAMLNDDEAQADEHADEQATEKPQVNEYGISIWKDSEVRLDLAKVYMDLGNTDGAFDLLNDVVNNGDATQIALAQALMKKFSQK